MSAYTTCPGCHGPSMDVDTFDCECGFSVHDLKDQLAANDAEIAELKAQSEQHRQRASRLDMENYHLQSSHDACILKIKKLEDREAELKQFADFGRMIFDTIEGLHEAGTTAPGKEGRKVDSYITVYAQQRDEIAELRAENARLKASIEPLNQELQTLRDREVCVGVIDDMKDLIQENDRLKRAIDSFGNGNQFDWNVLRRLDELEEANAKLQSEAEALRKLIDQPHVLLSIPQPERMQLSVILHGPDDETEDAAQAGKGE